MSTIKPAFRVFSVFLIVVVLLGTPHTQVQAATNAVGNTISNDQGTTNIGNYDTRPNPVSDPNVRPLLSGDIWDSVGNPQLVGKVNDIAIIGNDVYIGGDFLNGGGDPNADYIMKWNGTNWSALSAIPLTGEVKTLAVSGTDLYVGGSFKNVGGDPNADLIIKWDGSTWSALGAVFGTSNYVSDIAISGTDLYAVGSLYNVGGDPIADYVVKWNGSTWSPLGNVNVNGTVNAVAVVGTNVYIGGSMDYSIGSPDGFRISNLSKWDGTSWLHEVGGLGGTLYGVYTLATSGTDLYVGGYLLTIGNSSTHYTLLKWNGSSWDTLNGGRPNAVYAITIVGSDIYVGGGTSGTSAVAKWNGSSWSVVGADFSGMDGNPLAFAVDGMGRIYAVGAFGGIGRHAYATGIVRFGPDQMPPDVISSIAENIYPSDEYNEYFTVTFSEPVIGVEGSAFSLTTTGVTGAFVDAVYPNPNYETIYRVRVRTGVGDGTIRLDVVDNDTIFDKSANRLGGSGSGNGNFTLGTILTIDQGPPSQIDSTPPNPSTSTSATFTFSSPEAGATFSCWLDDVPLSPPCVSPRTLTGLSNGSHSFDIKARDAAGHHAIYGDFYTWTIDSVAPTISPGILRTDFNPTNAESVNFSVRFSESVTGVDVGDFVLTTTGLSDAAITNMSGTGSTRTVTVDTGTGDGTIRLDIPADATITDTAGNSLANIPYTSGEIYTIDALAPTATATATATATRTITPTRTSTLTPVPSQTGTTSPLLSSITRANLNPSGLSNVDFIVTFSEPVINVDISDFALITNGVSDASITGISGSGATRMIRVNSGSGSGTIRLDAVADASITNPIGYAVSNLPYFGDETYTIDKSELTAQAQAQIIQSSDDAGVIPTDCTTSNALKEIYLGECANGSGITSGFVFHNLAIPQGARILNASIQWTVDGTYNNSINITLYGEASANAEPFTTSLPSNRILTDHSTNWMITASNVWTSGDTGDTPDLGGIIEEIINHPDWSSGNNLAIIIKDSSAPGAPNNHRRVFAYERNTIAAAKLIVNYYDANPPTATITRTPTTTKTPTVTKTSTPTRTPTKTITLTPTYTLTRTPTSTPTETLTPAPFTPTSTPTITFTPTKTLTPTYTFTLTPSRTITSTSTSTKTETPIPTSTVTQTPTKTVSPTVTRTSTPEMLTMGIESEGLRDGWLLESSETRNLGGSFNNSATTFNLGDNAAKKEYRGILSFSTVNMPDTAVITNVTLKVKKQGVTGGGEPLDIFQGFLIDIKTGFFGTAPALQSADFQAAASKTVGPTSPGLVNGWYSLNLTNAKAFINKLTTNNGLTQIRLRFRLDDNNNAIANYLSLYSGNASADSQPRLVITYYVP